MKGKWGLHNFNLFALSAYSIDYILVKEKDLKKAREKLKELGCIVEGK